MGDTITRKPRRKRTKRHVPLYYVLEIKNWDWSFHFGVNYRPEDAAYGDYRHLILQGVLLRPKDLKNRDAELIFIPHREMNPGETIKYEPRNVGTLELHRGELTGLLSMPADALMQVLQMLNAGRFHYVVMDGERMFRRRASIRHYHIDQTYDDGDLPSEK